MLPYRLRPPTNGRKLREQRKDEAAPPDEGQHPYREGGPVERAVRADLLRLGPLFDELLVKQVVVAVPDRAAALRTANQKQHAAAGTAFAAFKEFFGANKVALLHRSGSLLIPRCDRNSYSQMLYSVCLSIMRQSFRDYQQKIFVSEKQGDKQGNDDDDDDDDENLFAFLRRAAYAVFTLYALYETNALPKGPAPSPSSRSKDGYLSLLPVGLYDPTHHRILYRRSFRGPIRTDPEHYGCLLQLRDWARAGRCRCKAASAAAVSEQSSRKCKCAVATDLVAILDRLLSSSVLEFSSYTGPCGLEGVAGHADYQSIAPLKFPNAAAATASQNEIPAVSLSAPFEYSDGLHEQMQQYISDRAAIRLPAERPSMPRKDKRIRSELEPVFRKEREHERHRDDPLWGKLSSGLAGGTKGVGDSPQDQQRQQHVSFGTIMVHEQESVDNVSAAEPASPNEQSKATTESGFGADEENSEDQVKQPSHELVFPDSATNEDKTTLRAIVETLLDRDDNLLLPTIGGRGEVPPHVEVAPSVPDEVSTIGDAARSIAESTIVSNVGRNALQNLLSQVGRPAGKNMEKQKATWVKPRAAGDLFLSFSSVPDPGRGADDDEVDAEEDEDSLQSSEEFDSEEESIAASRVGQKALQHMLTAAVGKSRGRRSKGRGSNKRARSANAEALSDDDDSDEEVSSLDDYVGADDAHVDQAEASVSDSKVGQRALQNLVSAAASKTRNAPSRKSAKSKTEKQSSDDGGDDDDDETGQGDASVAESRQRALRNLLSAATTEKSRGETNAGKKRRASPRRAQPPKAKSRRSNVKEREPDSNDSDEEHDDGDDGHDEAEASVAESKVGQRALQNLLSAAASGGSRRATANSHEN